MPSIIPSLTTSLLVLVSILSSSGFAEALTDNQKVSIYLRKAIAGSLYPEHFAFLKNLSPRHLRFISGAALSTAVPSWNQLRRRPVLEVFDKHRAIASRITEVYLNVSMSEWVRSDPELQFVDGPAYSALNAFGTQPDGIVVRNKGRYVVIEKILESKIGYSLYNSNQTEGFLRSWQQSGIHLPGKLYFSPSQIFIHAHGKKKRIVDFDLGDQEEFGSIESNIILFVTRIREPEFCGKVKLTPFHTDELLDFSMYVIAWAFLGKDAAPQAVDAFVDKYRPIASGPWGRPGTFSAMEWTLIEYLRTQGSYPTKEDGGLFEFLCRYGSRMRVFTELMDNRTRDLFAASGHAPAITPMAHWLVSTKFEDNPTVAASVLKIYLRLYGTKNPTAILQRLRAKQDAGWDHFLDTLAAQALLADCSESLREQAAPSNAPRVAAE